MCPFLIEHSDMRSSSDAWHAHTVDEAIAMISSYLETLEARESAVTRYRGGNRREPLSMGWNTDLRNKLKL